MQLIFSGPEISPASNLDSVINSHHTVLTASETPYELLCMILGRKKKPWQCFYSNPLQRALKITNCPFKHCTSYSSSRVPGAA